MRTRRVLDLRILRRGGWAIALVSMLAWHAAGAQVVAFGASNVYGWNVEPTEAFPARLELALRAQRYPTTVLNAGMFGNTTAQLRERMDRDIPSGTKIVLLDVSGGLYNDRFAGISHAQGTANLEAIIAALTARAIRVIPVDFDKVPMEYRQGDGRHLTPAGHEWLASQLLPEVTTALGPPPPPAVRPKRGRLVGLPRMGPVSQAIASR